MENYIVINGKKAELTEEQLKQLGINVEVKKETLFTRNHDPKGLYWSISSTGGIMSQHEDNASFDDALYENVNYFNDYKFAKQVALQQLLYRKLLKYAYESDAIVTDWTDPNSQKYFISKSMKKNTFHVNWNTMIKSGCEVYFTSKEVTERAIEDVVKPFMEEHPEFVW